MMTMNTYCTIEALEFSTVMQISYSIGPHSDYYQLTGRHAWKYLALLAWRLSALSNLSEESLITAYYGYNDRTRIEAFEKAIEAIEKANSGTDFGDEKDLAAAHFDSEQLQSGQNHLINLKVSFLR